MLPPELSIPEIPACRCFPASCLIPITHDRPRTLDEQHHAHALKARAQRRAQAEAIGVDAEYVSRFVEAFYPLLSA